MSLSREVSKLVWLNERTIKREELHLGARQKLNSAHLTGSLIIAGVAGVITESFVVFLIALGVLIVCSINDGGIRFGGRRN